MSYGNSKKSKKTLFKKLKEFFIAELILKIYILSLLIVVKTDISDFVLGVYLV